MNILKRISFNPVKRIIEFNIVLILVFVLLQTVALSQNTTVHQKFVKKNRVNLRKEPDGEILGNLSLNAEVFVFETEENWSHAIVYGWIPTQDYVPTTSDSSGIIANDHTPVYTNSSKSIKGYLNKGIELGLFENNENNLSQIAFWGYIHSSFLIDKSLNNSEFLSDAAKAKLPEINELVRFDEGTIIVYNYRVLRGTSESYQMNSNTYFELPPTKDYLILDISIENFSSKTLRLNPFVENLVVYDEEGRKYPDSSVDAAFDGIVKDEDIDEIPPGEKRRGEFAFKIPKGKVATLYYKPGGDIFSSSKKNMPIKIKIY